VAIFLVRAPNYTQYKQTIHDGYIFILNLAAKCTKHTLETGQEFSVGRKWPASRTLPTPRLRRFYRTFHGFGQAKFNYSGLILGTSQFTLLPQLPLKTMLHLKVVKIDSEIIISLHYSKSVTYYVWIQWKFTETHRAFNQMRPWSCKPDFLTFIFLRERMENENVRQILRCDLFQSRLYVSACMCVSMCVESVYVF